jgi:hypothetical protein
MRQTQCSQHHPLSLTQSAALFQATFWSFAGGTAISTISKQRFV